jgi:activator of HSP90 ATPase
MPRTIRQSVTFQCSPHEVYEALMDSRKHARFSGAAARISRKVGGVISAYDGYIEGVNLELVPSRKIVQRWRASDWPEGATSVVRFTLAKAGTRTRLTFAHSGVPASQYASLRQGWIEFYWKPMKRMLEG